MPRTISLLRHGKSSWGDSSLGDHDRPLKKSGKRAVQRCGQAMREQGIQIDGCLCSAAKRTRQTFEVWEEVYERSIPVDFIEDLYLAPPEEIVEAINAAPDEWKHLLLIGHNPGYEMLVSMWADSDYSMQTSTLARFEIPDQPWADVSIESNYNLLSFQSFKDSDTN